MDEKHLDIQNGSNDLDFCEENDEEIIAIFSGNSFEPSLDKKYVAEAFIAKYFSSYDDNFEKRSNNMRETSNAKEAELDKSATRNASSKSSYEAENQISSSRYFTVIREPTGYSSDNSASESSTVNESESEEELQPRNYENISFSNASKNTTSAAVRSWEEHDINSHDVDAPKSSRKEQMDIIIQNSQLIEGDITIDTSNPLDDLSDLTSSLNNIYTLKGSQSDRHSFMGNMSTNDSDVNDEPKKIFKINNPVLTDMKDIEPCPKISPMGDVNSREKLLNNMSESMACSKLPNDSESVWRKASALKNRGEIRPCLGKLSNNKENHPNETDVIKNRAFKRSLSNSPAKESELKIIKPSSLAESPTKKIKKRRHTLDEKTSLS